MWTLAAKDSSSTASVAVSGASRQTLLWTTLGYGLMILGAIGALVLICRYGTTLVAPSVPVAPSLSAAATPGADSERL